MGAVNALDRIRRGVAGAIRRMTRPGDTERGTALLYLDEATGKVRVAKPTEDVAIEDVHAILTRVGSGKGKILVSTGTGRWTVLAASTNDYVLTLDSTVTAGVKWAAAAAGSTPAAVKVLLSERFS